MAHGHEIIDLMKPIFLFIGKIMFELTYYEKLPEVLPQADIENEFNVLLNQKDGVAVLDFLEAIYELSSRQVNNYALVNSVLISKLNKEICVCWDRNSLENTEICVGIVINLGLQIAYEYFKKEMYLVVDIEVKKELIETFNEMGDTVRNVENI